MKLVWQLWAGGIATKLLNCHTAKLPNSAVLVVRNLLIMISVWQFSPLPPPAKLLPNWNDNPCGDVEERNEH